MGDSDRQSSLTGSETTSPDDASHTTPLDPFGSSRAANIGLGGLVGLVFSFIPFSPAFGGAVSGYLDAGSPLDGAVTGTLTGLLMLFPLLLFSVCVSFILGFVGTGEGLSLLGLFLLGLIPYTLVPSAIGGWMGAYAYQKQDTD